MCHLFCNTLWTHVVSHHWNSFFDHFSRSKNTRPEQRQSIWMWNIQQISVQRLPPSGNKPWTVIFQQSWDFYRFPVSPKHKWHMIWHKLHNFSAFHLVLPLFCETMTIKKNQWSTQVLKWHDHPVVKLGSEPNYEEVTHKVSCQEVTCGGNVQRASLRTVLCASNMAPARHDQAKPRPLL